VICSKLGDFLVIIIYRWLQPTDQDTTKERALAQNFRTKVLAD